MNRRILHFALIIVALLFVAACKPKAEQLRTGDIIFVGLPAGDEPGGMAEAIASTTGEGEIEYIHAAIVDIDAEGNPWVIDATLAHGVGRHPLDTLFEDFRHDDGRYLIYEVYRLKDDRGAAGFVQNATAFTGEEYDCSFLPGNGRHYCTELVYDSYLRDGEPVFEAAPMNFKGPDGEFDPYWEWLFSEIGEEIPQGVVGTNPQAMHDSALLKYRSSFARLIRFNKFFCYICYLFKIKM